MRKGVQSPSSAPPWVILSSLCMGSWATSFILLDPNNDSQVETSNTILSRQTQTMSTGSLLLREESEQLYPAFSFLSFFFSRVSFSENVKAQMLFFLAESCRHNQQQPPVINHSSEMGAHVQRHFQPTETRHGFKILP